MSLEQNEQTPRMDPSDLWREDVFTDRKIGTIRRLTPVKADGSPDSGRKVLYVGEASLDTPAGALPLNFEIPAETLEQAVAAYGEAVQKAFEEAMEALKEMRRRASSSLVLPPGVGPGAGGGSGKIKLT
ncbi:MAG: hypothetical protein ACHQ2Z_09955 [Elusimicrobiota bacterium]